MTKIPNAGVVREPFRSLENSDLGIVSDFGFRISNLITDLPKQNKTPCVQQPRLGVTISLRKGGWGGFKSLFLVISIILFILPVGCNYGRMNEQESIRTHETSIPEMPRGIIPASGASAVRQETQPENLRNPLAATSESVLRGGKGYSYFCAMCHGPQADGNGTVGQSFYPLPTNLKSHYVQEQPDGMLFHKISLGYKRHPPLASTVSEEDRWAIIHYIRSLGKKGSS